MLKVYYLAPVGGGDYHLYSPETKTCYLASLRGKLKKGVRKNTSMKPGTWLMIENMKGTQRWRIMERLPLPRQEVDVEAHQCSFEQ